MRHLLFAAALVLPAAAYAQDRPQLVPTRDVTIDYRIEGGAQANAPREMRMAYSAGGQKMRIEMPNQQGAVIMDRAARHMIIVMAQMHSYMERDLPPNQRNPFDIVNGQKFTRRGTETIAGLTCTVWEVAGEHPGNGCVTDDGIILRGESTPPNGERSRLIATAVNVAPVPPEMFAPPAGYQKFQMPTMPPGMMRPGAPHP